jgi:hypothetical protein
MSPDDRQNVKHKAKEPYGTNKPQNDQQNNGRILSSGVYLYNRIIGMLFVVFPVSRPAEKPVPECNHARDDGNRKARIKPIDQSGQKSYPISHIGKTQPRHDCSFLHRVSDAFRPS